MITKGWIFLICFFVGIKANLGFSFPIEGNCIVRPINEVDTSIVHLYENGDTLNVCFYSDSTLIEKRNYYPRNHLRMVKKYKDGLLFGVDESLNTKGKPIFPGTYSMGTGTIIEYSAKGHIVAEEFWANYELTFVEYRMKRLIKRVFYSNGVPSYSILTRRDGTILSKTSYGPDGVSITTTEYFDENLKVVMTLYGH